MGKFALAIVAAQDCSMNDTTKSIDNAINSFLQINASEFSPIVMLYHSISSFSPLFAENWRYVSGLQPVPAGSLVHRVKGDIASFRVATRDIAYRFPKLLRNFLPSLPKTFTLMDSNSNYTSTGISHIPDSVIIPIDDMENSNPNISPLNGVSTVFVIGHIHLVPSIHDIIQTWARGATICYLTDLIMGTIIKDDTSAVSSDLFGWTSPANPVPLHIQPKRGGRAEAERIWNDALIAMQHLCGSREHEGGRGVIINPVCRSLPPVKGSLPHFGPNYVFITVHCYRFKFAGIDARYFAELHSDVHAKMNPSLYQVSTHADHKVSKPVLVYSGYMPDPCNTLYAWKHCLVMAVEHSSASLEYVTNKEKMFISQTPFQREMCELVKWLDTFHKQECHQFIDSLRTLNEEELKYLIGNDMYDIGDDFFRLLRNNPLNGEELSKFIEEGNMNKSATLLTQEICKKNKNWTQIVGHRLAFLNKRRPLTWIQNDEYVAYMIKAAMERNIARFLDCIYSLYGPSPLYEPSYHAKRAGISRLADTRMCLS